MDDGFVMERMQLEFPDGVDGEPVITIGREVLETMNGLWKQCILVKVLGRNIALPALSRRLKEMWNPKGGMHVMDLPRQFFMIRFELEEEYMLALTGGPWRAFGSHLMVQAWSPDFDPLRDEIVTTPVWVRLSNIPVNFYHKAILLGIARGLGKPIKVDPTTLNFERARFARVCVEVNLSKPIKGTVMINGDRYCVAYEGLSNICSGCGIYGHLIHNCPRRVMEKTVDIVSPGVSGKSPVAEQKDDGFMVVRRAGRKGGPPKNGTIFAAGSSQPDLGRNLREISGNANMENVAVSNRFANLEEDMIEGGLRKVAVFLKQSKQGKSISQGREWIPVTSKEKNKNVQRDKRAGGNKAGEAIGPKPRQTNSNRPVRGLVFGPTRREVELSNSGKRMRMEEGTVGRPGGVFSTESSRRVDDGVSVQKMETATENSLSVALAVGSQREKEKQSGPSEMVVTSTEA